MLNPIPLPKSEILAWGNSDLCQLYLADADLSLPIERAGALHMSCLKMSPYPEEVSSLLLPSDRYSMGQVVLLLQCWLELGCPLNHYMTLNHAKLCRQK